MDELLKRGDLWLARKRGEQFLSRMMVTATSNGRIAELAKEHNANSRATSLSEGVKP